MRNDGLDDVTGRIPIRSGSAAPEGNPPTARVFQLSVAAPLMLDHAPSDLSGGEEREGGEIGEKERSLTSWQ